MFTASLQRSDADARLQGATPYATVLFPIMALTASALFEDYQWTTPAVIGVALACAGNVVMFRTRPAALIA